LSGHARTALLPELYRWIFLVPLASAVLLTLLGRPQRFRVTPKTQPRHRRITPAGRLLLPLLFLLSLQSVSLWNLLQPALRPALAPLTPATVGLNLIGMGLNLLLLLLAVRACFDRPGLSERPWFALRLPCRLRLGTRCTGAELAAISEGGVELRLAAAPTADGSEDSLILELPDLPPLPLQPLAWERRGDRRLLGAAWGPLGEDQQQALRRFLYGRPGQWPARRAPFEPLALAMLPFCLLRSLRAEAWFRRSLLHLA
jgi:cellulose synthase (UDP-forming)